MATAGGSILRRGKDKRLLIEEGPGATDGRQGIASNEASPPSSTGSTPNKYSPFNLKSLAGGGGGKHGADGVQVSYSNLAAQVEVGGSPDRFGRPVMSPASNGSPEKGDASLDISTGSVDSARWSGSERSWTPSAVRERIVNWPAWMSIKTFVAAICFLICVHGALSSGYVMSVITTIEKRFEIRSKTSGLIVSSYEFGSLLSVLFVSYFGSQGHVPRWIGVGSLLLAFGSILWTIPHFVAQGPTLQNYTDEIPDMCPFSGSTGNGSCGATGDGTAPSSYVFVLILAQILIGVGGSPIFTLGTTYIDNHVSKESSSIYLAFMYVFVAFGPVCGFLLGALMLSKYVDPPAPVGVTMESPSWIGLWWGGFILLGILYFFAALPFFGFPRTLPSAKPPPPDAKPAPSTAAEYGKSLKNIPFSVFRLLTNSVYMIASLNACMDLAIVSGFTVFLPKYLETQFTVSKSVASILTGSVAIPGAIVGIFLGGWVLKKFKLQLKGVGSMVALVNVVCLFGMIPFFFLGCSNLKLAGVFQNYDDSLLPTPLKMTQTANLTIACNQLCNCERHDYQPICGPDQETTYFSPCYAGCKNLTASLQSERRIYGNVKEKKARTFSDCSCIPSDQNGSQSGMATAGACAGGCNYEVPFLIYLFLLTLVASLNQMPLVMVTLRAVAEEEKAFALGVQVVLLRLLAYIPAPILFGFIIDTTCLVWKPLCGQDGTTCLLYDIETFRTRYGSIALVLKVTAAALSLLLVWSIRQRGQGAEPFSPPITMSEIAHRLGDVDNLHIRPCPSGLRSWMSDDSLYSRPRSPRRHQKTLSC